MIPDTIPSRAYASCWRIPRSICRNRTACARWSARSCKSNQTQFNRADGTGYDFLAEIVEETR